MNRKIYLLVLLSILSFFMFACSKKKSADSLGIDVNHIVSISLMEDIEIVNSFDNLTSDDQIVLTIDEALQQFYYGRYVNDYLNVNEDAIEYDVANERNNILVSITTLEETYVFIDTAVSINDQVYHLTCILEGGSRVLGFTDIQLFDILIAIF